MSATRMLPRLDGHVSQEVFRVLLDAMARPGRLGRLPDVDVPPTLAPVLALADVDSPVALLQAPSDTDLAEPVHRATGAPIVPLTDAELVCALRPPTPDEIRTIPHGRRDAPELAAKLALACHTLRAASGGDVRLGLRGPGVPGRLAIGVNGVPVETLEAVEASRREPPCGIDVFCVDTEGGVIGLPRSTRIEIDPDEEVAWATQP